MHVGLVVDAGWLDAVSVYILPKGRWLPGSSHALDLKSTRLLEFGCRCSCGLHFGMEFARVEPLLMVGVAWEWMPVGW